MDTSSSTNSNRIGAFRHSETLHLQLGCRKLFGRLNAPFEPAKFLSPKAAEEGIRPDIRSIHSTTRRDSCSRRREAEPLLELCNCSRKFGWTLPLQMEPALHCGCQVMSTRTGISFLTGIANSVGGSILKSDSVAGIVPDIRV